MKGRPEKQAKAILSQILALKTSRHQAKENAQRVLKSQSVPVNSHTIGRRVGIHSISSYTLYLRHVETFIKYAQNELKIKDAMRITESDAAKFIQHIANKRSYSTTQTYCCALEKMCQGMEKISQGLVAKGRRMKVQQYNWTAEFLDIKKQKRDNEKKRHGHIIMPKARRFRNPETFVNALERDFKTAARLQLEAGLRLSEATYIQPRQLKGRELRLLRSNTKGGRTRTVKLPADLAARLKNALRREKGGCDFRLHRAEYTKKLQQVASAAGEEWFGSHGLRWNFAETRMKELTSLGFHQQEACAMLSKEIGHSRIEISMWYLRR